MLHVLKAYLPLRKALLIASETLLLTLIVAGFMTAHLLGDMAPLVRERVYGEGLTDSEALARAVASSFLVAVMTQIALSFNELYDFRVASSKHDRFARFVGSSGVAIVLALLVYGAARVIGVRGFLVFPGLTFSQTVQTLVLALVAGFTVLYVWRLAFYALVRIWRLHDRVLILGSGSAAVTLVAELMRDRLAGYQVVGMVEPPSIATSKPSDDSSAEDGLGGAVRYVGHGGSLAAMKPRVTGALARLSPAGQQRMDTASESATDEVRLLEPLPGEDLLQLAERLNVNDLVVALEDRRGCMPTEALLRCRLAGLGVEEGEALYERVTGKIAVEAMRPSYLIFNPGFVKHPFSEAAKRLFDLICALTGILLASPLMLLTAIAVRVDSRGPILFRQERSGRFGQPITIMKFRSMTHDAEKATGPVWAQQNDPRITRVGKFIRKTRLDELPQLFNVLGGSMSMVGPRPERPHFIEDLKTQIPYYDQRHIVKPGVTGWAQINYPYGNTVEDALQKLQYDLYYIKCRSVAFDASIVVQTIKTVLLRKGT